MPSAERRIALVPSPRPSSSLFENCLFRACPGVSSCHKLPADQGPTTGKRKVEMLHPPSQIFLGLTWKRLGKPVHAGSQQGKLLYTHTHMHIHVCTAFPEGLPRVRWFPRASLLTLYNLVRLSLLATHLADEKIEASECCNKTNLP